MLKTETLMGRGDAKTASLSLSSGLYETYTAHQCLHEAMLVAIARYAGSVGDPGDLSGNIKKTAPLVLSGKGNPRFFTEPGPARRRLANSSVGFFN